MTEMTPLARRDAAHVIHPVTAPREMATRGARVVVEGDGWWITDDRGRRIIDGFAGLWCVSVGHRRSEIIDAVRRQMETLEYFTTFHGQSHPRAIELAEKLCSMFPPEYRLNHVMFSSGGSEANETNFKLVRMYWAMRGEERRNVIVARHHGYHGLTIATMTATGIMPMRWHFGPEAPGFAHVPAPYCYRCELGLTYPSCKLACADSLEELVGRLGPETVAAFIAEPVIGAGGIIPPPDDYFARVREICDRHGILLILDEVVTGFGRTGSMFGFERYGVRPDVVTLAKGITSGYLPLGASVVSDEIYDTIASRLPDQMPISHGFTYMGHPTCCAAALANIELIERERLHANAAEVGSYLIGRLRERIGAFETVGDIRGVGLMIGIELVADRETKRGFSMPHTACTRVEHEAWERGLYCRAMGTEVVGLAPPLTIDRGCADQIVDILAESIAAMEADMLPAERARAESRAAHRVATAAEVFDAMAARFDPAKAAGVDLCVQFVLGGEGGGVWLVTVRGGDLSVERCDGERPGAAATIRADAADYVRIANGELSGADAFSTQRLTVDGDLSAAATLASLGLL
jgi:adenosylmethionine-8-amino-7-oxononanoate aminotransferase/putative sterol carrier protein